jgi:site-specific recombinase XerD
MTAYRSPATQKGHHAGRTPANAGKTYPAEVLTTDEVKALIRTCSNRAPSGIRNRALIVCLYRGGLRLGEALALCPKDVDAKAGTLTVLHGKGDKRRTVGLDEGGMAVIERWLDRRKALGLNGRQPLFCTLQGEALKPSYVRALLPRLAAKAGIEKRVHPHGLRHTHAAELAAEGLPMNLVQAQLGHSSLATTDRYLRHIAPAQLIDAMKQRVWELEK